MLTLFLALNMFFVKPNSYQVENWYFEEQFSYGSHEEELLHTGSQVIMVDQSYYILDSALSTVIELLPSGSWQEYPVGGDGPGECPTPNSLIHTKDGFVLFKSIRPSLIYTDLKKESMPKNTVILKDTVFARNLFPLSQGQCFLLNTVQTSLGGYSYTLSVINGQGKVELNVLETPRKIRDDFPIWFFRNSWAATTDKVAIITNQDYSIDVFTLNGELKTRVEGPKDATAQRENALGACLQGVFYAGETLLILPFSNNEILEFHAPEENKIIRVNGVRASNLAQYFWLDRDTLAVMYGWSNRALSGVKNEEEHFVAFFKRSRS